MKIWQLRKGCERKIRMGYPWIFSNELSHSPKGIEPGEPVELQESSGRFLARGYGHPNSLICFRRLTSDFAETDIATSAFFLRRFKQASRLRQRLGFDASYRLCFAEADDLPGLIVDRYQMAGNAQALVVQSSTAGMDRLLDPVLEALREFAQEFAGLTHLILSNNSKSRTLENLSLEPRRVLSDADPEALKYASIQVRAFNGELLTLNTDLLEGQKTGFFLDQHYNVTLVSRVARTYFNAPVRVLDLCAYVGQWSAHLAHALPGSQFTLVDASQAALQKSVANLNGSKTEALKLDVLTELSTLPERAYDVVVCDPPAFIKRKKDLNQGKAAYVKMNRDAFKRVAPGGLIVSCSCSGLLSEEEFEHSLQAAISKSERKVRWLYRGSQSPDHPIRMEFPEGQYLKCRIGVVD